MRTKKEIYLDFNCTFYYKDSNVTAFFYGLVTGNTPEVQVKRRYRCNKKEDMSYTYQSIKLCIEENALRFNIHVTGNIKEKVIDETIKSQASLDAFFHNNNLLSLYDACACQLF